MSLLILPNTLFNPKYFPDGIKKVVIWEHPQYFTKYKYNKKRIVLHRASMKYYEDLLKKNDFSVSYVEFKKIPSKQKYMYFDPIDKIKLPEGEKLESPNFLLTTEDYTEYRKKTSKFFFNAFYMWGKKKINVIPNVKSKDKDNRKSIPKGTKIPKLSSLSSLDNKYIIEGKRYCQEHFPKNYGTVNNFQFPITHTTAKKWLNDFISKKFKKFGDYQDYTLKNEHYMFHSILSTSINIGLLNPLEILDEIKKVKSSIKINSYEGLIRQYFWREYQRYCYIYEKEWNTGNYFGNAKLLSSKWYSGQTGIEPVDDAIKDAFNTGYLHHIRRLMIIANYMNLSGISPKQGMKWFMEFSCDSYHWVMVQNVYEMGFFKSGGKTMRKPYVSSSNYVIKMSNYSKGEWSVIWDEKYHDFIKKHKQKLWKYRYHFPSLTSNSRN